MPMDGVKGTEHLISGIKTHLLMDGLNEVKIRPVQSLHS